MKAFVYIIFSNSLNKFYIGSTTFLPKERLAQHNEKQFENSFTGKGIPWSMFFNFPCQSNSQAIKIERHIKNMRNRKYIHDLKKYPEMVQKLKSKYL